jgi:polysaccharide export outer membrane protein
MRCKHEKLQFLAEYFSKAFSFRVHVREGTMPQSTLRPAFLLACLGLFFAIAGCANNEATGALAYSQSNESASVRAVSGPYSLRANDQLHIQVYNEPTITGDYVVDGQGTISVPIAGRVKAAGLTVEQLEHRVTGQLNHGILKDARVNIQVTNYAPFYIRGEVKKPGEYPYKPGLTVGDAVALAGGYTYRADESHAYVRASGAAAEITRPLNANPPVAPGDDIRIPERFL